MASDAAKTTAQEDEQFFDAAFQELNSGNRVQGLWAKCFAEADGDDAKARAAYIRLRVARLMAAYEAERAEKFEAERSAPLEADKVAKAEVQRLAVLEVEEGAKPKLVKPKKSHRIFWAMMLGTIGGLLSIFSFFVVMESSILRRNFQGDFLAEFYRTTIDIFKQKTLREHAEDDRRRGLFFWE